jgi:hypothetical protein
MVDGRMAVRAQGLAAFFSSTFNAFQTLARIGGGAVRPVSFNAVQSKSDRERIVDIHYDAAGRITSFRYRNNGRESSGDVSAHDRAGTIDPITAFLRLRAWAMGERSDAAPTLKIFDGRKRYDIEVSNQGSETIQSGQRPIRARVVKLVFIAHVGFEPGDTLMTFPGQTPSQYALVYFSETNPGLVVAMRTVGDGSNATVTLRGDCRSGPPPTGCAPLSP